MTSIKKEYAAVDIARVLCAFMVIAIHAKPFVNHFWLDAAVGMVTRFAVPFFFLSSSYFVFIKLATVEKSEGRKIIQRYLLRLLRFYLFWYIVYTFVDACTTAEFHSLIYYIRQFIFPTNGSVLWFLSALIWGTLIVNGLKEFLQASTILVISMGVFLIGYMCSTLSGVMGNFSIIKTLNDRLVPIIGIQNGLFFAFPYVALGLYMQVKNIQKFHSQNIIGLTLSFLLLAAESLITVLHFHAPQTFLWISAIPMTWFFMKLSLTMKIKDFPIYVILRKMSVLIYVVHPLIIRGIKWVSAHLGAQLDAENIMLFLLTAFISLGISYVLVLLSKQKAFHWLIYIM